MPGKPISERIEVPGVRPATFKLVRRASTSFFLYRSTWKLGTAQLEENGAWTASFKAASRRWIAEAEAATALLRLVGTFVLAGEAREQASRPLEKMHPELRLKGKATADQRLSVELSRRLQERRIKEFDELIHELRKRIIPEPKQ